jgi:hypothetical protein
MARSTGVSQPHLHNILKGIRDLPPELADQLLILAGLNLYNLIGIRQLDGGTATPPAHLGETEGSTSEIERIMAKLGAPVVNFPSYQLPDDSSMEPGVRGGDIAYYEPGTAERTTLDGKSLYLVRQNGQLCARYLRMGAHRLYLVSQENLKVPAKWDYVSLADRHILEVVTGRIVWICRKMEKAETCPLEETRGLDRRAS